MGLKSYSRHARSETEDRLEQEKPLNKEELNRLIAECGDSIIWDKAPEDLFQDVKKEDSKKEDSIFRGRTKVEKDEGDYRPAKIISNVEEWSTWCDTPRTEAEIREKCLTDYTNVCFTYLCEKQTIREGFIPELMALSTGLLTKTTYEKYWRPIAKASMILAGVEEGEIDFASLPGGDSFRSKSGLCLLVDRLNWEELKRNCNFSPAFQKKFAPMLSRSIRGQGTLVREHILSITHG